MKWINKCSNVRSLINIIVVVTFVLEFGWKFTSRHGIKSLGNIDPWHNYTLLYLDINYGQGINLGLNIWLWYAIICESYVGLLMCGGSYGFVPFSIEW